MSAYAIVVSVLEARRVCFIATPFAKEFEAISSLIIEAANRVGLQSIRTDKVPQGITFTQAILDLNRSATIIAAVCSPEPGTGKPNPNVMYELGLAQALGKPTIILTNEIDSLPSDVASNFVLVYTPQDIANPQNLILKIQAEMNTRLQRMKDPLTDSAWHTQGISVAQSKHRMLMYPAFWENFQTILAFAKRVHQRFQTIDTGHVDELMGRLEQIVSNPNVGLSEVISLNNTWKVYNLVYHQDIRVNVFDTLTHAVSRIELSFDYLLSQADDKAKERVENCKDFYDIIKSRLNDYRDRHDHLTKKYGGHFSSLMHKGSAAQVYLDINELSDTTKDILIYADGLIRNLVDLIVE